MPDPAEYDDPARWHHPHYEGSVPDEDDGWLFRFRPFSGSERMPETPDGWFTRVRESDRAFIEAEYAAARAEWAASRYRRDAAEHLPSADRAWKSYLARRQEVDQRFAEFLVTPDQFWRSQTLRWLTARSAALDAAREFDGELRQLEAAGREYRAHAREDRPRLTLAEVAEGLRVDVRGWPSGNRESPLADLFLGESGLRRAWLAEVGELSGARAT